MTARRNKAITIFTGLFAIFATSAVRAETIMLAPGPDAQDQLQEALILASPGDVIHLQAGFYELTDGLSLDVSDIVLEGEGMDKTILSFKEQASGSEGLLVTSDRVVLRDFAVEDAKGDAIKVNNVDQITFLRIRTEWTGGPKETNGAYGLYPVSSTNVLIDGAVAIGASDAGIYVGQSQHIIVRNSTAQYNVAGIEIENSYFADVHDNLATHNTGGILVFDLPELLQQGGHDVRVFRNKVIDNDTPNFAPEGNIVGTVPMGTGIMITANRNVEIFENEIDNNATSGVLIAKYPEDTADENYLPYPRNIHVHDNLFGTNGNAPDLEIGALIADMAGTPLPDVIWDGAVPFKQYLFGLPSSQGIYVQNNKAKDAARQSDFVNLNAIMYYLFKPLHSVRRSVPSHAGSPATIAPVQLPQDERE